jgi:hypothetical protein
LALYQQRSSSGKVDQPWLITWNEDILDQLCLFDRDLLTLRFLGVRHSIKKRDMQYKDLTVDRTVKSTVSAPGHSTLLIRPYLLTFQPCMQLTLS